MSVVNIVQYIFYIIFFVSVGLHYYNLVEIKEGTGLAKRLEGLGNNTNPNEILKSSINTVTLQTVLHLASPVVSLTVLCICIQQKMQHPAAKRCGVRSNRYAAEHVYKVYAKHKL
jgi:hypothetical protein